MAGDNDLGKKSILRGDDLPAEDAIPSASGESSSIPDYSAPAGVTRWDEADEVIDEPPPAPGSERLKLGDDDALPWLESPDDIGDEGVDSGRVIGFVLLAMVALVMVVGAVWLASNRASGPGPADGSTLQAEAGPYKVAPESPGGKTFAGTGDTSFAVSEGETRSGSIAGSDTSSAAPATAGTATPVAQPSVALTPAPKPSASATAASATPGVGVQIGAYTSPADAEKGWTTVSGRNAALLSGVKHRVVEGQVDIGKVYRLQAVTADIASAQELCGKLKAAGQDCQVKR